jgi:hypothetical protein
MRHVLSACMLLPAMTAGCTFSVSGGPVGDPHGYSATDLGVAPPPADAAESVLPADLSPPVMPTLVGTSAAAPTSADLTTDGTLDWAHWGFAIATDFDHKSGAGLISNYSLVGSSLIAGRYSTNYTAFSWSDGAPHASAQQSTTGVYVSGADNGFSLTAPADATEHTLQLYISVYRASGTLQAKLSDGSAPDYTDTFTDPSGSNDWRLYTLRYQAASPGQTLLITWTETESFDRSGNVTLQAAALR